MRQVPDEVRRCGRQGLCGQRWSRYAARGQRTAKGPGILSASVLEPRILLLSVMFVECHRRKEMGGLVMRVLRGMCEVRKTGLKDGKKPPTAIKTAATTTPTDIEAQRDSRNCADTFIIQNDRVS